MIKIVKKTIIIICLICVIFNTNICFASNTIESFDIWSVGKGFIELGVKENNGSSKINETAKSQFQQVIDFLWGIGLLTIFLSTVILGIKYMLVLPEERSRIKAATTPYVIGVIIIFGALTIWKLIINVLDGAL